MQIHCRWQPNHQINYPNHQYHSQIANKHIFFFTFHLFKALIQIEANTQLLHPDLWCECCRLSPTRTNHFCWRWRWKKIQ